MTMKEDNGKEKMKMRMKMLVRVYSKLCFASKGTGLKPTSL